MIVSIAGLPGAGKSTVGRLLAKRLGFDFVSAGAEFRNHAKGLGMTVEEHDKYLEEHPEVDEAFDEPFYGALAERKDVVVDGRAAFHFLPDSFKVFLLAPLEVRASRVAGKPRPSEESLTAEQAARSLRFREEQLKKNLQRLYGVDVLDSSLADLVLDSSAMTPEGLVDAIMDSLPADP